jgi:hypothetical protein
VFGQTWSTATQVPAELLWQVTVVPPQLAEQVTFRLMPPRWLLLARNTG